jgi:hypothetical protein
MAEWPAEAIETLRACIAGHLSGNATARLMSATWPGMTRNKVMGKAYRMGLKFTSDLSNANARADRMRDRKAKARVERAEQRMQKPAPALRLIEREGVPLLSLKTGQCRWPISEGPDGHLFCGEPDSDPYCPFHHRIAYRPITKAVHGSHHERAAPQPRKRAI